MHLPDPKFPPLFTGHDVKAPLNALAVAAKKAALGELGAGDIVWGRNASSVDIAFVFEPDVSADRLCEVRVLVQAAIIDSLGVLMPEQTAIQIAWPNTILCNGAKTGETAFISHQPDSPNADPDWAVAGISIALERDLEGLEPGIVKNETSIIEEDGGHLDRTQIMEALAAHLLNAVHTWEQDGVRSAVERWIGRLIGYGEPADIIQTDPETGAPVVTHGEIIGVGDQMQLMVRTASGETVELTAGDLPGIAAP